jgi:hypothetical protein
VLPLPSLEDPLVLLFACYIVLRRVLQLGALGFRSADFCRT